MFAVFHRTRKAAILALALAASTLLGACDATLGGGPSIDAGKPVPVALLVPRGSGKSGDGVLSQSLENAARMAIADLGNVQIDLRVYDTAGSATTAAAVANQAVDEGAKIILGPVYAEAANAAGLAVAGRNINVISFSNNTAIAGGNLFVLGPTFQNTATRLAGYAAAKGKTSTVLVHGTDVAGSAGSTAIKQAYGRSAASIVGTVTYDLSQQGVIDSVARVKNAVDTTGADSIFLTATTAGALPLFSQLLPEAGVSPQAVQYIGLTRWDIPAQTLALPGVQGGWFALPDPGKSAQFQSRYATAYGGAPHPIGGLAYDGIAAIGALVGSGNPNALSGAALTQGAGFQGVSGIFRLRPNGTNERGLAVATIQNQQVVVIDPAPSSFSGTGL